MKEEPCTSSDPERDLMREQFYKNAKPEIRDLVWHYLPPDTPIGRAEEIACEMLGLMAIQWGYDGCN